MELNVRDWLIILGSLVAAGFVLDAYRRVRAGYTEKLRMSAKQRDEGDELFNPELPGGGARVVSSRTKAVPSYEKNDEAEADGPVPVLMDSVEEPEPVEEPESFASNEEPVETGPSEEAVSAEAAARESLGELADEPELSEARVVSPAKTSAPESAEPESVAPQQPERKPAQPRVKPESMDANRGGKAKGDRGKANDNAAEAPVEKAPEEIIVLHVVAPKGEEIPGAALLQILLACDVRFGRMNIFHRYEEADGAGAEQFSVVNMVAPGTFDLDAMENFSTPGVSFFMGLPGPKDPIKAFDCMVETAQVLVKNLHCELQDEAHSVCTTQTLEHLRQRIRDFERRQLTLV